MQNCGLLASSSFVRLGLSNKALEYWSNRKAAACVCPCMRPFLMRAYRRPSSNFVVVPWRAIELSPELPSLELS